jgi:hypothetical protein
VCEWAYGKEGENHAVIASKGDRPAQAEP